MAEGGGLLNRYTLLRRIEGSNPSVSASHRLGSLNQRHRWPLAENARVSLSARVHRAPAAATKTESRPEPGPKRFFG